MHRKMRQSDKLLGGGGAFAVLIPQPYYWGTCPRPLTPLLVPMGMLRVDCPTLTAMRVVVSEMTYTVSSGTNSTILYYCDAGDDEDGPVPAAVWLH